MQLKRIVPICILTAGLTVFAVGQSPQDAPVLKTRPHANSQPAQTQQDYPQQPQPEAAPGQSTTVVIQPSHDSGPDAIPQGTRFLVTLLDPLDTKTLEKGQHFRAELRETLVTPSGMVIPRGREIHAHVATFERGYLGARMMFALDEMDTSGGWVPLIGTVTGVPGDPSIKSTSNEGEIMQKGPDKKRLLTNAAIGAGVGAAAGAAAGGGKGAAAGAAAGAGVGTTASYIMQGQDLKLDQGTNLEIRLDRDLVVPGH
jgi:hypothetical protein